MSYRSRILTALTVSLIAGTAAFSANFDVATEGELTTALAGAGAGDTITLTAPITLTSELTLPDVAYSIIGGGNNLSTFNGNSLSIPANVIVDDLLINNVTTYVKNDVGVGNSGGAINNVGIITINNGAYFSNNNAGDEGGAIYNDSSFTINNGATFTGNTSGDKGGAIVNKIGDTFEINGGATFTGNIVNNDGGAIFSAGDFTINDGATFTGNHSDDDGGAVYTIINDFTVNNGSTFTENTADGDGGAINVSAGSNLVLNNGSTFIKNTSAIAGGAIINLGTTTLNNGATFIGNSTNNWGGAIYNDTTLTINDGAVFRNNKADVLGGAIYSWLGTTTLIARTNNMEFSGNTANGSDNAIYLDGGPATLNLNASSTASINFNDGIGSGFNDNVININATNAEDANIPVDAPTSGRVYLNADMSGFGNNGTTGNTVNLYGGTLALGPQGKFFNVANFTASAGTTLDLNNGKLDTLVLGTADINGMNLAVDADMSSGLADTINATDTITNNDITITKINVIKEGSVKTIKVDPDNEFNITLTSGTAAGKVYNYNLFNNNGSISLKRSSVNPVVQSSGVSQQNAYLNVANTNNIAFNRADNVLNMMDNIKFLTGVDYDNANKVAILEGQPEYSRLYGRLEEGAVWFRPFNSIENITIDGVEGKVDSTSYGMLLGFDSPLKRFKRGVKGMLSVYGGYGGASQEYKTIDLYQNGGLVGVMGSLYKGDLYTSLSASVGGYGVLEKIKNYGSSNYGLLTTSIASKTGYNFHLPGRTVLQLNGQAAYSFVSSNDYDNAQGTRIDTAPLHVLQIIPGVKISKHIGSWQPYLSTSVVFNALNDSAVRANDIVLPDTQIGDYIEYGAGIEKHTESGTSGYLQAMVRNGARSGINFKFGLKFPVGKKEKI